MSAAPTRTVGTVPGTAPTAQSRSRESRTRFHITTRGVGMLASGLAITVVGVGFATPILVYVGMAMTCAVIVSGAWVAIAVRSFMRSNTQVHRAVSPHPLTAGLPGHVSAVIYAPGGSARASLRRVQRLDLREQAAAELTGGTDTKASLERGDGTLSLRYELHPVIRGRWPLGPALVRITAPFGLMFLDIAAGAPQPVPVWPAVVDLSGTAGMLMGHAEYAARGARTPSADDASLREYRSGDDLRRVHWPSSARRGTMVVRADERTGRRPATVIVDPPSDAAALERAVTAAASITASVLSAGHPARLVGAGLDPATSHHLGERGGDAALYELLNQTVDLRAPDSRAEATADLVRSARLMAQDTHQGEVTVAIVEPLAEQALHALAPLGESGRAWAIVRGDDYPDHQVQHTVVGLQKAGWRVATTYADDDLEQVWTRLLAAGDLG